MKTCKSCNEWLDQLAPNGDAVCDACYAALQYQAPPASNRARTVYKAKEKQFLAMVKMGKQAFLAGRVSYMETIHDYDKYLYRVSALERLSEQLKTSNIEIVKGWLTAFREMRGDPLLLVFCPNWAFWHDEVLATDELRGRAAAYRRVHKS